MSLSLSLTCRPLSWQTWKMSGRGLAEDEGLWAEEGWEDVLGGGKVEAGAEERRFWGFQTPYLSNISTHFEQVQSQFMKQSTSIYRSPLTGWCFMLGVLCAPLQAGRHRVCVYMRWIHKYIFLWLFQLVWGVKIRSHMFEILSNTAALINTSYKNNGSNDCDVKGVTWNLQNSAVPALASLSSLFWFTARKHCSQQPAVGSCDKPAVHCCTCPLLNSRQTLLATTQWNI